MANTPEEVFVYARAAERLLIVMAAIASLFMGWNLFRIGVVQPQSGELKGKSWSVKLQRCGPGIFFAVFGTAVLLWGIYSRFSVTDQPDRQGSTASATKSISYFGGGPEQLREIAQSINRVAASWSNERRCQEVNSDPVSKASRQATDRAIANLSALRDSWIRTTFGDGLEAYKKVKETPSAASEAERRTYDAVSEWY